MPCVQMLPDLRPNSSSAFGRAIYIVCMVVVFCYILFDVLDLDGSDFPRPGAPVERNVVIAEVPKVTEYVCLSERTDFVANLTVLLAGQGESLQYKAMEVLRILPLNTLRSHRYKVSLARSAPPDPSLSF